MEAGSGRRNCPFMLGIDRLISFLIIFIRLALNIFREWRLSQFFKHSAKFIFAVFPQKANCAAAARRVIDHFRHEFFAFTEIQLIAYADLSRRINYYIPQTVLLI